ncbi:transcription factor Adf-1-like [Haematobia irritans]|uniref:transcription factor Adf-1-like n=1 Tax=Haematobia irritans TaxID=7368 RepID=UPI003F50B58E
MDEEKLIEAVKKYPILFDLQCREYKNTQKKEDVWKGISNEIGWSTELCKKKWKNLRDTYKKTKQRLNMPSGSGAEVKRTWKYFENMSFLDKGVYYVRFSN